MLYCYLLSNGYIFRTTQECSYNGNYTLVAKNGEKVCGTLEPPVVAAKHTVKNVTIMRQDVVMYFEQ